MLKLVIVSRAMLPHWLNDTDLEAIHFTDLPHFAQAALLQADIFILFDDKKFKIMKHRFIFEEIPIGNLADMSSFLELDGFKINE